MEKMFCLGLAVGMVTSALIVANSYKMRSLVKKSQAEFMEKVNSAIDEKMNASQDMQSDQKEKSKR